MRICLEKQQIPRRMAGDLLLSGFILRTLERGIGTVFF